MYSITGQDLATVGVNLDAIVPTTLTLTNKEKQIPIFVRGEDDKRFNPTDEIIFYGERQHGETSYIDPYSDENIYWLSWGARSGIRMATKTPIPDTRNAQLHQHFLTRAHFEKDQQFRRFRNANLTVAQTYIEFSQGLQQRQFTLTELPPLPDDSWFWAQLSAPASKPFTFYLSGVIDTGRPATVRVGLHGRSNTAHDCDIWLNDKLSIGKALWTAKLPINFRTRKYLNPFSIKDKTPFGLQTP